MCSAKRFPCLALLAAALSACAHGRVVPTEEQRASFGRVGVACAKYGPEATAHVPGAGEAAGRAVGVGLALGSLSYHPKALLALSALGVAAAPVAAAVGYAKRMPAAQRLAVADTARRAFDPEQAQRALRDELVEVARREGAGELLAVEELGPAGPGDHPSYSGLRERGIETVLEVSLAEVGLASSRYGSDPPLWLFVKARRRLVRVADRAVLFDSRRELRSNPVRLAEWAAEEGRRSREAFEELRGHLAQETVLDFFLLYLTEDDKGRTAPSVSEPIR